MRSLLGIVCLLVAASLAFGQADRGTITGRVVDPAGAVVANAPLQLINTGTGGLYTAATTATGNYTFAQLPVGTYTMTVEVPGFKSYTRQNLGVQVAQTLRVDIQLEVGTASESVTVTAEASMLRTESAELSTNVTTTRLNALPILGVGSQTASSHGVRNPLAASQLQPGVYFTPNRTMRVNGMPSNTFSIRVDGQDATNGVVSFAQAETQPSVDAIEEVAIQTSNYAAEFGQAGAGLFNFTTKSGANDWHGTAYDYYVNEALWAHQPYNHIRPRQRRNDYGGTLGGPVWIPKIYDGHDKTFFFFNYEEFREKTVINNQVQTVPLQAYRDGDFTGILTGRTIPGAAGTDGLGTMLNEGMIFDPLTEQTAPDGTRVRTQFPGNMIPASRMDASAMKVQSLVPLPNYGGAGAQINNYLNPFPSSRVTPIPALKIDHNLNEKMKASVYWSTTETAVQYCIPLCGSTGLPAPIDPTRGTFIESYTVRANFDYTVTPTMLLHFGAGFLSNDFKDTAATLGYDANANLGISGGQGDRFPVFGGLTGSQSLGGLRNIGPGAQSQSREGKPTGQISLSWVRGNHTMKFGVGIRLEGYPTHGYTNSNGNFSFSTNQTTNTSVQGQALSGRFLGFPYASFLLGQVNSVTLAAQPVGRAGRAFYNWFAQDTWKITSKLTLDYGLRWDIFTYPREQYGRAPSFDPNLPNPAASGHVGATVFEATCNCRFAKNYKFAYEPRLGVAYQIDSKTVLRAGFGISYSMSQGGLGQQGTNAGASQTRSNPNFGDSAMVLSQGIPFSVSWPNLDPGLYPNPGTRTGAPPVVDQNLGRPARQWQWQIGLQREVMQDLVIEASYVANRGVWWRTSALTNPNAIDQSLLASYGLDYANADDRTLLTKRVSDPLAGPFYNRLPYSSFPASTTVANSLRPYPQFGNLSNAGPNGKTWYDSLQLKATKRFSYGLDFTWTYTYSKELQLGTESDFGQFGSIHDIFNRNINKTLSASSRPHWMVLALNYTLQPYYGNRILNLALADWTIGAVLQYGSGTPISTPGNLSNNNSSTILRGTWATRVPGQPLYLEDVNCHCFDPSRTQLLNPDAWTDTPSGQFSPSAQRYNDFRVRRRPQELMSIARNFRIKESVVLMIRAEFNNIFNRTYFGNPSTNRGAALRTAPDGSYTSGFGTINNTGNVAGQRQGTLVMRLTF